LLNLKSIHNGCKLAENLICLLMELELSGNKVREVSEGFRSVENLDVLVKLSIV
jgi:hypothetical protein